jgi:hypothetical protein
MDELDRAGAEVLASPISEPTPTDLLRTRVRRRVYRRRAVVTVVVACVLAVPAVALANANHPNGGSTGIATTGSGGRGPTITSTTTSTRSTPDRATFEIRPVASRDETPLVFAADSTSCTTPGPELAAAAPGGTVLFDRDHQMCYFAEPALVTATDLASASVFDDSTASQWGVNLQFTNDSFITKIAEPLVNHEVVFVVNGVVQSAPTINPGITGRNVEITGNFTRSDAVTLAAEITGVAPSTVHVYVSGAAGG